MADKKMDLHIRLSKSEFKQLKSDSQKYADGNMSKYVRELITSQSLKTNPYVRMVLRELSYEINKIGVNINQIVKNNNSGLYSDDDKEELVNLMNKITEEFICTKRDLFGKDR